MVIIVSYKKNLKPTNVRVVLFETKLPVSEFPNLEAELRFSVFAITASSATMPREFKPRET